MTTERQKKAVSFCEEILDIKFTGDIDNFNEVSVFLSRYLEAAKDLWGDMVESYQSFIADKDWA